MRALVVSPLQPSCYEGMARCAFWVHLMTDAELQPVIAALKAGDRAQARRLLQPLLRQPSADRWYAAALLSGTREQAVHALERAITLDSAHMRAHKRLTQLQTTEKQHDTITDDDLPPLAALVADDVAIPVEKPYDPQPATEQIFESLRAGPLKKPVRRRRLGRWRYVILVSMILMSLSSTYFVMLVLGSGIPGQLRSVFTGVHPVFAPDATLVYATPVAVVDGTPFYAAPLDSYGSAGTGATPVTEIQGTPVYARPDAVVVVAAAKTTDLIVQQPISDILEPGFAHEYVFTAQQGEEVAVGVQFFSPTAQGVGRNVTILDPDELSAERVCQRDQILQGDNGVVFICPVHKSGHWKVRLFGREGESSGAYVVAIEKFE